MEWHEVIEAADDWAAKAGPLTADLRRCTAQVFTHRPVGYYYHPDLEKVALYATPASGQHADERRCKAAACRALGSSQVRDLFISYQDLADPAGRWVKIAYSPLLRRTGELLNFFPGQYPGGLPNAPSPLAAMLTAGLLGSGLGWAGGKAMASLLPDRYGDNLGRAGAIAGGLLGATPGAIWALVNRANGQGITSGWPLNHPAGAAPKPLPATLDGTNRVLPKAPMEHDGLGDYIHSLQPIGRDKRGEDLFAALEAAPLAEEHHRAVRHFLKEAGDAFGAGSIPEPTLLDVNIDHLGRTLWRAGASPALAATTMGAMYAGQQMPDARSRPGWVTSNQLGQLAQNAVGDYAKGLMVGAVINTVVGTPWRASTFGATSAVLGVLGTVVPRLFGDKGED